MAIAKSVERTGKKIKPKRRSYTQYRFIKDDHSVIFLDVGAFSSKQSWALAYRGLHALGIYSVQNSKTGYWSIAEPQNAPEKGPFVIHDGAVLKID